MNGDLSIAPQPGAVDLAPSARRAVAAFDRSTTRDVVSPKPAPGGPEQLRPADRQPPAATRLKALLTDPTMQVSTHRDDGSGRVVLRVQSLTTGELVEQIPSEELVRLYAAVRELLVDERA